MRPPPQPWKRPATFEGFVDALFGSRRHNIKRPVSPAPPPSPYRVPAPVAPRSKRAGNGRTIQAKPADRYGRLTVLRPAPKRDGRSRFVCQCDCGSIHVVRADRLISGSVNSCGCLRAESSRAKCYRMAGRQPLDLTGRRFGRLIALEPDSPDTAGRTRWQCICDCGELRSVHSRYLRNGHTRSCGCLNREVSARNIEKAIAVRWRRTA